MRSFSLKLIPILRVAVALVAYFFVGYRLIILGWDGLLVAADEIIESSSWLPFVTAIILMPAGWLIEAQKWKMALAGIEKITLSKAFRGVWYGVVTGFLTPNRMGEPLGRMALISPQNHGKAAVLAIWCGVSQQSATLIFGFIGAVVWMIGGKTISFLPFGHSTLLILILATICIFILALINLNRISKFVQSFGFLKFALAGEFMELKPSGLLTLNVLLLSGFRYIVFSTQMLLMFNSLGVEASVIPLYAAIFLTYLFTSFIPTFVLSEAGVRAGFALIFMGLLTANSPAIVSATFLIWALNVALPALIAAWFPWFKNV